MGRPPRLVVLTEPAIDVAALMTCLPAWADLADVVVLRWPHAPVVDILPAARTLAALSPRPALFLSDRPDLARTAGVEGVQLRETSLDASQVRAHFPSLRVGVSRHDERGLLLSRGAEFALLSPVFATASKPGVEPIGIDGLRRGVRASPIPVLALGGIDAPRAAVCREAGAAGVAVLSAVWSRKDPTQAVTELRRAWDRARH